ncbi:MAG: MmgE/PrpD family protein [Pseudomonadales bacterium]|jgi:2-methylcitrate dehydratase PrpD|uniref:MmgE/PrpD family protein n=1 Tax=marine metagenome TaxID=408172 RepID=A0A381V4C7_9ZZZZ|nr:MmgE/PrpD family protein [Pseudomonadales bacterium]HCF74897.1 2-methylcitrate dehydratase [Gammaproteobacteria bacterium]|tara:strand:- start:1177 stop:2526 length:1350 start_codon:yes stop_codon:yes gene_type:complete
MTDHLGNLCEFLSRTSFEDLPSPVIQRGRQVTADTIAAIVGGSAEPEVLALTESMAQGSSGKSTVLGSGKKLQAGTAAFLNGTAGTFLEMDEGNQFCQGHPAIHVLPAVLACTQSQELDGRQFLLALVLGYEVGSRIGIGATIRKSMHPHGTWGTVGGAVAVAKLAGATPREFRETINVASTLGLGTSRQTMLQGGTVRNSFAGVSGQMAVMAWDMVRAGFNGEHDGLSTIWGSVLSENWDPVALTEELGTRWEIARNYFKRHSCCRYCHGALDVLARICADTDFQVSDIDKIKVETYSLAAQLNDRSPRNTLAAKFSVPFAIASTLVNGHSGLASFTWEAIGRDEIMALASRVEVVEDKTLTAMVPDYRPARVKISLKDGQLLEGFTRTNRGDSEDPYTQDVLTEKFFELTTRVWPSAAAEAVFAAAMRIERLGDVDTLTGPVTVPLS